MKLFPVNKIIAHRGASAYAPENTIAAFEHARALGCHVIEFDVMLSADGIPCVIHDESLKRTTNGQGDVGLVNHDYLDTLDAGRWFGRQFAGEKIPHLDDVIKWCMFANVTANIEIKPYRGMTQPTVIAVLSYIHRYWQSHMPPPLISSFDVQALSLCHDLAPELLLGFLLHTWQDDWLSYTQALNCYSVHLNQRIVTPARVEQIKNNGYQVFVYTVNQRRLALKLFDYGVDAVFSDYPDLLS